MLDHAKLLWNHIELLANLDPDFHERVAVVRAEAFGLGEIMSHNLAWQIRIERFAMTTPLALMRTNCRLRSVFQGDRAVRTERFGFVEQTQLIGTPRFALRTKQFTTVSTEPLLGKIAFRCHEPQRAT
jgi:hypothetical protein